MKVKIAAFKHVEYDWVAYYPFDDGAMPRGYARTSSWVEVDFPELPTAVAVNCALEEIHAEHQEALATHQRTMQRLNERRAKFLALTHQPE